MLYQLSYFRKNKPHQGSLLLSSSDVCNPDRFGEVGIDGFEPPKAYASRFTVCPNWPLWYLPNIFLTVVSHSKHLEPMEGFEPTTPRLQITCSGQLSYIGISTVTGCKGRDIFLICKFFGKFFQTFFIFASNSPTPLVQRTLFTPLAKQVSENRVQI